MVINQIRIWPPSFECHGNIHTHWLLGFTALSKLENVSPSGPGVNRTMVPAKYFAAFNICCHRQPLLPLQPSQPWLPEMMIRRSVHCSVPDRTVKHWKKYQREVVVSLSLEALKSRLEDDLGILNPDSVKGDGIDDLLRCLPALHFYDPLIMPKVYSYKRQSQP